MTNIYDRLGVPTLINARGTATRLSGSPLSEEVRAAMSEAATHCVDMALLQSRASEIIAELTGAEAGIVTSGAAAGLQLAAAACLAGLDPAKMDRLPDTQGMRNEIIVARSHRNGYDHALRAAGARLIEVGLPDRVNGTGVRDAETWHYEAAVTDRSCAMLYVAHAGALQDVAALADVARRRGLSLIVDAAGQLPPMSNLRHFIAQGADLVVVSGGKFIGGPQASGLLYGRRDLIGSAVLQTLDMDIPFADFRIGPNLVDVKALPGLPQHGIGRSCKVGKEQVVGLLVALRRAAAAGAVEERSRLCQSDGELLRDALAELPGLEVALVPNGYRPGLQNVQVRTSRASALLRALRDGEPRIELDGGDAATGLLRINLTCLRAGQAETIAARIAELIAGGIGDAPAS